MNVHDIAVDHLRAIRSSNYRAGRRAKIAKRIARKGSVNVIDVAHEPDGSCCRKQPWPVTSAYIFGEIIAEACGVNTGDLIAQIAEHEPAVIFAPIHPKEEP